MSKVNIIVKGKGQTVRILVAEQIKNLWTGPNPLEEFGIEISDNRISMTAMADQEGTYQGICVDGQDKDGGVSLSRCV